MKPHYTYSPGTDGVDNTFDIYCDDRHLISVHYWDAKQWAEAVALHITKALNRYDPKGQKGQVVLTKQYQEERRS